MLKYLISTRLRAQKRFWGFPLFLGKRIALNNKINCRLNCLASCRRCLKVFLFNAVLVVSPKDYFTLGESLKSVQKNEAKCESLIIAQGERPTSYSHTGPATPTTRYKPPTIYHLPNNPATDTVPRHLGLYALSSPSRFRNASAGTSCLCTKDHRSLSAYNYV